MSLDRTGGHRRTTSRCRAFRPTLDGGLEPRFLLSFAGTINLTVDKVPGSVLLKHPKAGAAYLHNEPPFVHGKTAIPFPIARVPRSAGIATETARGGASMIIATPNGSRFTVQVTQFIPTPGGSQGSISPNAQNPIQGQVPGSTTTSPGIVNPNQPMGTVRAYGMSGGRVGLILDGTTIQTEVDISPYPFHQRKGYAHSFGYGQAAETHILNVGQITVNSGVISAINGYHTVALSGPLVINGGQPVDRLSFNALLPGASIVTSNDLNTLDVLNGVNLNSGPGIVVGRDLNLINVGQNLDLSNGASLHVARFLGLVPQPPKGTATGANFLAVNQSLVGTGTSTVVPSLSGYIQGNVNVGPNSVIFVGNGIPNTAIITTSAGQTTAPSVLLINGALNTSSGSAAQQILIPGLTIFNTGTTITNQFIPSVVNSLVFRSGTNTAFPA
jgi:hypothetical protein